MAGTTGRLRRRGLLGALLLGALALAALLAPAAGARAADGGLEALVQELRRMVDEADAAAATTRRAPREPDGPRAAPADSELGVAPLHRLLRHEVARASKQLQQEQQEREEPPRDGRQLAQVTGE